MADYDRNARIYDRLIGNRLYNRLVWGTSPRDYADFATEALAPADGPFLDAGCGTLVFTAEPWRALAALRAQLSPGGTFFASMLVRDRAVGGAYLRVLQRAGEVGPPRTEDDLAAAARHVFGDSARVTRTGSMAWLRATG